MGGASAGEKLGKTAAEGQELLDNFFKGFPKVKEAIDYSKQFLLDNGYVEDWAGRRRHLPEIYLPDYEAKYKDNAKTEEMTFNPLIECEDREQIDSTLASFIKQAESIKNNKEFDRLVKEADKKGIILKSNKGTKAQAERQCFNARIQGGAASLTKLAMVNIDKDEVMNQHNAHLIITVHDEVLVECPEFYSDIIEKRLPQIMIDTAKPYMNVPMKCDAYCVDHWYEDEFAAEILKDFNKLVKGDKPITKEEARERICNKNSEIKPEVIDRIISGELDIVII